MPTRVKKQECRDSEGKKGSWVTYDKKTGKTKTCHQSKKDAETTAMIIDREAEDAE